MKKEIIIINESLLKSWLKDIVSIGIMFILLLLNVKYLNQSPIVELFVMSFYFLYVLGLGKNKKLTIDEAIKQLQKMQKNNKSRSK